MSNPRSHNGSVMIYVLWTVTLLSLLAVCISSQASTALRVSDRLSGQMQTRLLAQAGVRYAVEALLANDQQDVDSLGDAWANAPALNQYPMGDGAVTITPAPAPAAFGMADEERRLNLNTASERALKTLFEMVEGVKPDEAEAIARSIQDWRDADDEERPHGAETYYYRGRGRAYECKNGPFEHVQELRLVKGVSEPIYQAVEPYVTVYGSGDVNVNTAGAIVLQALGFSQAGVSGLQAFRTGEDGAEGTGDDRTFSSPDGAESDLASFLPQEDVNHLTKLALTGGLTVRSRAFRGFVEASDNTPSHATRAMFVVTRAGELKLWTER